MKHFWNRWKKEYLLELREFHRSCEKHGSTYIVQRGDIVTVYDEGHPRGLWRLGKIEDLVCGTDGVVQGVCLRVTSKTEPPRSYVDLYNTFSLLRFAVIMLMKTPSPRTLTTQLKIMLIPLARAHSPRPVTSLTLAVPPEDDLFVELLTKLVPVSLTVS